jgi:hypothetical protein
MTAFSRVTAVEVRFFKYRRRKWETERIRKRNKEIRETLKLNMLEEKLINNRIRQ